jgi:hypothetical protein
MRRSLLASRSLGILVLVSSACGAPALAAPTSPAGAARPESVADPSARVSGGPVVAMPLSAGVPGAARKVSAKHACFGTSAEIKGDIYAFDPDLTAQKTLKLLLDYAGLASSFKLEAANVPSAAAVIEGRTRYVLYNQTLISDMKEADAEGWMARGLLAHEIGHHVNGHTLDSEGSRPATELEADWYAGFLLRNMGATRSQAVLAVTKLSDEGDTPTHPGRSARVAACVNGWTHADDLRQQAPSQRGPSDPVPVPEPQARVEKMAEDRPVHGMSSRPTYVLRAFFPQEPQSNYLITSTDDIVYLRPDGVPILVAKKVASPFPAFVWLYSGPVISYGVDAMGRIWGQYPNGMPVQIGIVSKL